MIVDAHVHLAFDNSRAAAVLKASAEPSALLAQMDRVGIAAAVVLGLPGVQTPDEVLRLCSAAPNRFFPLLGVNPRCSDDVARIAHTRRLGFYGLKLHPRLNEYAADDPILEPVLAKMCEHELTAVFDALSQSPHARLEQMEYHAFDRWARKYPSARMVLAHACAPHVLGAFTVVKSHVNVRLDVSFSLDYYAGSSVETDLAFVSDKLDRSTLYGSDFPQCAADVYLSRYMKLLEQVPNADKHRLLAANAIEAFQLPLAC